MKSLSYLGIFLLYFLVDDNGDESGNGGDDGDGGGDDGLVGCGGGDDGGMVVVMVGWLWG